MSAPQPASLAAERAVRFLRNLGGSVVSVELVREVLATRSSDERTATRVLESAFGGDRRLSYRDGVWALAEPGRSNLRGRTRDPDRVLVAVTLARRTDGGGQRLRGVAAARLRGSRVIATCSGVIDRDGGARLRAELDRLLVGAIPVIHDVPGAVSAVERWLGRSIGAPVSLRDLGRDRLGLRATHGVGTLLGRLGIRWRDTLDPSDVVAALDVALARLRRPGEPLASLRRRSEAGPGRTDLRRFAFDRSFLSSVPHAPGTYRFYDADDRLLYVGKSGDLSRRIHSYFHSRPSPRVRRLLDKLWRIEYRASGSDLEAMLREARQIRRDRPAANVARDVHRRGRRLSPRSLMIVEPAEAPAVLRAFLVRHERLVGKVALGPRGGGLERVRDLLESRFFGDTDARVEPDLDGEIVMRWLAANDRVVAFDPTDLAGADDVIDRLRSLVRRRALLDAEDPPVYR